MQQNSDMKHTEFTNIHNIVYYSQQLWSHHYLRIYDLNCDTINVEGIRLFLATA